MTLAEQLIDQVVGIEEAMHVSGARRGRSSDNPGGTAPDLVHDLTRSPYLASFFVFLGEGFGPGRIMLQLNLPDGSVVQGFPKTMMEKDRMIKDALRFMNTASTPDMDELDWSDAMGAAANRAWPGGGATWGGISIDPMRSGVRRR